VSARLLPYRSCGQNHGIDQHQQCDRNLLADQSRGKAAHGLRNDHNMSWLAIADCMHDGVRIFPQAGRVVGRRQRDRNGSCPYRSGLRTI
jgi:hypothetical protein